MTAPAVEASGLLHRYGRTEAVRSLDLSVRVGEMFGLIGPDGAGKTTTLRAILGLLRPSGGTVRTLGLDPRRKRRALARKVGYLAQTFSLYGDLTVDENVAFFASIHGVRRWRSRRAELLEMLRLTPFRRRLADRLSGGMKQKLALACTLVHTPELLVLDEPTRGVDPVSRREFWRILDRLRRRGLTVLMTTAYLDEAERCHRVGLMDRGRLLVTDTPDDLRRRWKGSLVEVLVERRREAADLLRSLPWVSEVQVFGGTLHATLPGTSEGEAATAAAQLEEALRSDGIRVEEARPVPPGLEDVFIALLRKGGPDAGREGKGGQR